MVVVGIIAVLSGLTAISFRAIAKDAKLATGKNTVMAVLDHARSLAMKNNRIVLVVFRPRMDGPRKQFVEAVLTEWSGQSCLMNVQAWGVRVLDRFVPIQNTPARALPSGVKIACPDYGGDNDIDWAVVAHLPNIDQETGAGEAPGAMIGVMFSGDGTCIAQNSATDSDRMFVDFNDDRIEQFILGNNDFTVQGMPSMTLANWNGGYFLHALENEEPFISIAPYLCVFDDDHVRELYDTSQWTGASGVAVRTNNYREYITQYADRLHFNRYTGVVMK
jgi:hypothetical protein